MPPLNAGDAAAPGFAELFASLPVAVLLVNALGRVARANATAEQLLNRSERAMVGQRLGDVLPWPDHARDPDGQALAAFDSDLLTPSGRMRVDLLEAPVADFPGWRLVAIHPSASARTVGDVANRAAGAHAAIGAAAMLAHEIKNPLSGIRGAAQLIGAGELSDLIVTEVDRIAALIDTMQDFSDTRALPVAAANIYPVIAHARSVALAGFGRDVTIEERFDPSLPPACVNLDALTQILLNLLKNAAEAVRAQPAPRIVLTTAYRHGIAVAAGAGRPRRPLPIELCVRDNGPGAPAEITDHLFEPFVSGRPTGQGLGLALVDKLVRDMGGIVHYAREGEPQWTVLRVLLPRGDG